MKVICVFMYVCVPFAVKVRVRAVCPLVVSDIGGCVPLRTLLLEVVMELLEQLIVGLLLVSLCRL